MGMVLGMGQSESTESTKTDPLLGEVLAAIASVGMSRTGFGYRVAGDPTLILKMERGRRIKKPALRAAIEKGIATINDYVAAASALE